MGCDTHRERERERVREDVCEKHTSRRTPSTVLFL